MTQTVSDKTQDVTPSVDGKSGNGQSEIELENAKIQKYWQGFAKVYTEHVGEITLQGARALHSTMQLSSAKSILEVACGGGIGTRDILSYLRAQASTNGDKPRVIATDFSPAMLDLAREHLQDVLEDKEKGYDLNIQAGNAMDLKQIDSGSMDRYIASLALQMVPDVDQMLNEAYRVLDKETGIAGFIIWGREEKDAMHTFVPRANRVINESMGQNLPVEDHPNYKLGSDMDGLLGRMKTAGFENVLYWPMMLISPGHSVEDIMKAFVSLREMMFSEEEEIKAKQIDLIRGMVKETLDRHSPMGMEVYLMLAYPRK